MISHGNHDPGCFNQSSGLLALYQQSHQYALVVFDREGSGQEAMSREEIEQHVEEQVADSGWNQRVAVVVIDPELENWVWSYSPHVSTALGWKSPNQDIRDWLVERSFLETQAQAKPTRPKEAMVEVLFHVRKGRSASIFKQLATSVSLSRCEDPDFRKFRQTLQIWFPAR